jgi:hypothetical protein
MYIQYIKMLAVEFFVKSQALKAESDIKIIKIESNEFACWDLYTGLRFNYICNLSLKVYHYGKDLKKYKNKSLHTKLLNRKKPNYKKKKEKALRLKALVTKMNQNKQGVILLPPNAISSYSYFRRMPQLIYGIGIFL